MFRIKYIIVLLILNVLSSNIYALNILKDIRKNIDSRLTTYNHTRADKYFEGLSYIKAIEKYGKVLERNFSPDSLLRKLAISYFKIGDTRNAEIIFKKLVTKSESESLDIYYYAQSLKYNEKYDEADIWIKKYRSIKNDDSRGELQYQAAPLIKDIYSVEKYKIDTVRFNSKYSDFGAVVYNNKIFFASGRNDKAIIQYNYSWKGDPFLDVYQTYVEDTLAKPKIITKGLNSRFHDGPIFFSDKSEEVYITRNDFKSGLPRYSGKKENNFKLYWAKKTKDKWGELEEMPFNSKEYSCGHASVSIDGKVIYFASDMPGGYGGSDIYYSIRTSNGWDTPVNLGPKVNTEGDEMFPFIGRDGDLFFTSNGHIGLGGLDIFIARLDLNNNYIICNMGYPLNSSSDDFSFYLEGNGEQGYFASNRSGGKGDDDIYKFTILQKTYPQIGTTIHYDLSKWEIRADAAIELDKVLQYLQNNKSRTIELASHTDARGLKKFNQVLSQKRARSAVDYLVSKGIKPDRITAIGYGETKLKNTCSDGIKCTEEEHQENRRTEIKIIDF